MKHYAGIEPAPWTVFESDNITQEMIDYTKQWSINVLIMSS